MSIRFLQESKWEELLTSSRWDVGTPDERRAAMLQLRFVCFGLVFPRTRPVYDSGTSRSYNQCIVRPSHRDASVNLFPFQLCSRSYHCVYQVFPPINQDASFHHQYVRSEEITCYNIHPLHHTFPTSFFFSFHWWFLQSYNCPNAFVLEKANSSFT